MTDSSSDKALTPTPPPARRRRVARGWTVSVVVLCGILAVLLVAGVASYSARRAIAERIVTGWLERQGVDAELSLDELGPGGFSGRLRAGPAADPDLIVDQVEVDTAIGWWWDPGGLAIRPTRIRLVHPVVKAKLSGGKLTFGSLDRIVQDFLKRPPQPDQRGPRVLVERGEARVTTDGGLVRVFADAEVDDGKLIRLAARLPRTVFRTERFSASLGGATVTARTQGDRLTVRGAADIAALRTGDAMIEGGALTLDARLPYPDARKRRGDGAVSLRAGLTAARAGGAGASLRDADLTLTFAGAAAGWIDDLRLSGDGRLDGRAAGAFAGELDARGLTLALAGRNLRLQSGAAGLAWSGEGEGGLTAASARSGETRLEGLALTLADLRAASQAGGVTAGFSTAARVRRLMQGDLTLTGLGGDFRGDLAVGDRVSLTLAGGARGQGAFAGLGPARAADDAGLRALKRAAAAFRIEAPGLRIALGPTTTVAATAPVRLVPASGGVVTLTPRSGQPVFGARAGFDLRVAGGGLPRLDARVSDYVLDEAGLRATGSVKAAASLGPVSDGAVDAAGVLRIGAAGGSFTASRCAVVSAAAIELGESDLTDISARLCPAGAPLARFGDDRWSFAGRIEGGAAAAPSAQIALAGVGGRVTASGGRALALDARLADATVSDTAATRRFNPLRLSGQAALAGDALSGAFTVATPAGQRIGDAILKHDLGRGTGGVVIDASGLVFAEGGLQPAALSPLAEQAVGTQVAGRADVTGRIDWARDGLTSSGRIAADGLAFKSPAGQVSRLDADIVLTSLLPLTSAPGQSVTVARLDGFIPVENAGVRFQLTPEAIRIEAASFNAADGRIIVEPMTVPYDRKATIEGAVQVEGVQLGRLVEASNYADRVTLDAKVSGRLPLTLGPAGLRFQQGRLAAIQPGRLAIKRELLVGLTDAVGGEVAAVETPVPAPVATEFNGQDFAYQALSALAFDILEAELNSLPEGRLGVLFKLRGRFDPAVRQELVLTIPEILDKSYMDRPLPLPSDTGVNLTLDTSWNFDELLRDVVEVNRIRQQLNRSGPVQPPAR